LVDTFPNLADNPEQFTVAKADSGDDALILAQEWAQLNSSSLIIVDSVDSLVPKRLEGKEIGETDVGSLPKLMSDGCRRIKDACDKSGSTVIFLNQLRSNIGGYGNPDTTSGGRALGFYASQRIQLKDNAKSYQIKDEDGRVVGHNVRFFISKNSYAVPYVDGEFPLIYGKGFDTVTELFDLAASLALIESEGTYFLLDGKKLHRKTYIDTMRADPAILASVQEAVYEAFPETFGEDSE
jgi:recombination protein RecA